MHSVFFGGIAQYFDSAGVLVQDNNVPFVKTIARVTRTANGSMAEYKLPIEMPGLMGAGSEFISLENIPRYANEVIKLDELTSDTTLVGYIYGGINSSAPNIFFTNTGTQSAAGSQIFKVKLLKNPTAGMDALNLQSTGTLKVQVYPNPNDGKFTVIFNLAKLAEVKISLVSISGKVIEESVMKNLKQGENIFERNIRAIENGGTYLLTVSTPYETAVQKIIIEP